MKKILTKRLVKALDTEPFVFFESPTPKRKSFFDGISFRDEDEISTDLRDRIKAYLPKISKAYAVKRSLGDLPLNIDSIKNGFRVNNEKDAKMLAIEIRNKFELGSLAIDIFAIVRSYFNIYVLGEDLGKILGIYSTDSKGNPIILYNNTLPNQQRNVFTLAHKLGHHLIHEGESRVDSEKTANSNFEKLANIFAEELLLPETSVTKLFKKLFPTDESKITITHLVEMSEVFKVSYSAVSWRLKDLELISETTFKALKQHVLGHPKYNPGNYYTPLPIAEQLRRDLENAVKKGKIGTIKAESILGEELSA